MNISELKEWVGDKGQAVSSQALSLLDAARHIDLGVSVFHGEIKQLRQDYDAVQHEFREYDQYFWSYLGMSSRPIGTNDIDDDGQEIKVSFDPNIHGALSLYANYLLAQRENIRTTLRDIADQTNSLEARATNNLTIWLAALSLLVALVSLLISIVALSS